MHAHTVSEVTVSELDPILDTLSILYLGTDFTLAVNHAGVIATYTPADWHGKPGWRNLDSGKAFPSASVSFLLSSLPPIYQRGMAYAHSGEGWTATHTFVIK